MRLSMRDIWRMGRGLMRPRVLAGLLILACASLATGMVASSTSSAGGAHHTLARGQAAAAASRPNIVFVLTDDLSMNLLQYMPQRAADAAHGADVQQLLRVGLAVLPVALLDLHRELPPHHEGVRQRGSAGRLQAVLRPRRGAAHVRGGVAARRLQHRDDGQVPQRIRPGQGQRPRAPVHVRAARVVRMGRRRLGIPGVQLLTQRGRHGRQLRPRAVGLPDRRARRQGR